MLYLGQAWEIYPWLVGKPLQSAISTIYLSIVQMYSIFGGKHTAAVILTASTLKEEQKFEAKVMASSVGLARDAMSGCCISLIESRGPKKFSLVGKPSMICAIVCSVVCRLRSFRVIL